MANYVCTNLEGSHCTSWAELPPSPLQQLAITPQQADDIIMALLLVFVTAYGVRQVMNIILNRKY